MHFNPAAGLEPKVRVKPVPTAGRQGPGEPKFSFTFMKSVAEVLSNRNRARLKVIRETSPDSMAVLAMSTGRRPGNLSRTLKTMSRYGLVDLHRERTHIRPVVKATEFRVLAAA